MEESSSELRMELVTEVLARLLVKSPVRFRCVCKAWCSLISSPDFSSLPLSRYHNDDHTHFLIANETPGCYPWKYQWMLLSTCTYEKITGDDFAVLNNQHITDRVVEFSPYFVGAGSCVEGLLLLCNDSIVGDEVDHQCQIEIMLWNPMLGKTHKFSAPCTYSQACLGLGFSHSRNDYKVMAIGVQPKTSVHVYSLRNCSWRSVIGYRESIIYDLSFRGFNLKEGKIHFISVNYMEESTSSHMVSFDVDDEVSTYTKLLFELVGSHSLNLIVYHEKIGLLDIESYSHTCCLWVMENDHVAESWRKLYTTKLCYTRDLELDLGFYMQCFKKNGQFMIGNDEGRVKLYDVESGEVKLIGEGYSNNMVYCTLFKESLVL